MKATHLYQPPPMWSGDPHDISVLLPGNFNVKSLIRDPLDGRVATLGFCNQEFETETEKFSVYVGFARKPTDGSTYIRFIAAKSVDIADPTLKDGIYIAGNPLASDEQSGRRPDSYFSRYWTGKKLTIVRNCYKVIAGLFKMLGTIEILKEKGFEPLMITSEILCSPIGKQLLASFLDDPIDAPSAVVKEMFQHLPPKNPLVFEFIPLKNNGESAIYMKGNRFQDQAYLPIQVTLIPTNRVLLSEVNEWIPDLSSEKGPFTSFMGKDVSGFEIEPGIAFTPNVYEYKKKAWARNRFLYQLEVQTVTSSAERPDAKPILEAIGDWLYHIPYDPMHLGVGLFLNGDPIKETFARLLCPSDDNLPD